MENLTKVVFVIDNLNAGGAERIFRTLVNDFDRNIFDVTLLLFNYDDNVKRKYSIPNNVETIILNKSKKKVLFRLLRTLKELNPDIVISTLAPVNILCIIAKILIRNGKTKYVIRETTIKSISIAETKDSYVEKFIYKTLIKIFYNYADSIISLSEGAKVDLINNFNVLKEKIKVIHNPLDIEDIKKKKLRKNRRHRF